MDLNTHYDEHEDPLDGRDRSMSAPEPTRTDLADVPTDFAVSCFSSSLIRE